MHRAEHRRQKSEHNHTDRTAQNTFTQVYTQTENIHAIIIVIITYEKYTTASTT